MKAVNYEWLNSMTEKNSVVLFGGTLDKSIPVSELAQSFEFNFKLYNRSFTNLSIKDAQAAWENCIEPVCPEGILIHLGAADLDLFKNAPEVFDSCYISLLSAIRKSNPKTRIALVSLYNENANKNIFDMNRHIKAIASSESCDFFNIDNAKLWNPAATREVISFVYNLGFEQNLKIKKPLRDIAKILYSYAYANLLEDFEHARAV